MFLTRPTAVPHQVVRVSGAGADRRPRFGLTGWYFTPDDHFSAGELRQVALMRSAATKTGADARPPGSIDP